jgi:hypothetical protein
MMSVTSLEREAYFHPLSIHGVVVRNSLVESSIMAYHWVDAPW